jgi:hypothetical protein
MMCPLRQRRKESDPELDPLVRGADPGIRIRTIMSRIPNNGCSEGLTWPVGQPGAAGHGPLSGQHAQSPDHHHQHHCQAPRTPGKIPS